MKLIFIRGNCSNTAVQRLLSDSLIRK